jgi:hypothetical protein
VLGSALKALDIGLADIDANADALASHALAKPSLQTGKTLLSTLVVLKESDTFRKPMQELMAKQKEVDLKQVKSAHRADIDLTFEDVIARAKASDALIKKAPTNRNLVDNLILNLMTGVNNPPRRLEWASVNVRDFDEAKDNCLYRTRIVWYYTIVPYDPCPAPLVTLSNESRFVTPRFALLHKIRFVFRRLKMSRPALSNVRPPTFTIDTRWGRKLFWLNVRSMFDSLEVCSFCFQ